jgi:hypothetical protein
MHAILRALLAAAAVLVVALACAATSHAEKPITTPAGLAGSNVQQLPDGPGKELLPKLCAGCHDLTFTISTRETEDGWTRIVNDMRSKGADGSEEDFAKVIAYLATYLGKPGRIDAVP